MLAAETAFPFAGSFALWCDPEEPAGRLELARILEHGGDNVLISLPLRLGAVGNRRVPLADLVDGTPLTTAEEDEVRELRQQLRTRTRNRKKLERRYQALRERQIHWMVLRSERAKVQSDAELRRAA